MTKLCRVEGCAKNSRKLGMCNMHYHRVRRSGDVGPPVSFREADIDRLCSVESCGRTKVVRGWCRPHYERWKKYGHPENGGPLRTSPNEPMGYLEATVLNYAEDDCLIWPYGRYSKGYGQICDSKNGRNIVVSRLVCERVHGPPPSSAYQAAHSCGNGHLGCVNPRHLSWKTPIENASDKLAHGTVVRGESHPQAKLSSDDVRQVRSLIGSVSYGEIAAQFGVSAGTIGDIARGKIWKSSLQGGR